MSNPETLLDRSVMPVVVLPAPGVGVLGTAFLIHSAPGYAVTARHVIARAPGFQPLAEHVGGRDLGSGADTALLLHDGDRWKPVLVVAWEGHPTEDVALLRLHDDGALPTPVFDVTTARVPISTTCSVLGYPEDDYYASIEHTGQFQLSLTYIEGYVRRYQQRGSVLSISGSDFLELSTPAGGGCSGAPVFARASAGEVPIPVAAVYVGERRREGTGSGVGYAVPFSAIAGWQPGIAGGAVLS